ncbi:MAG: twin-arginine translocase TatA/TatE family subunit [Acidobacteriota bacterium]|nr:twin-arginine translocase TatA/TatE family subunit [Acidobacteriota bacterium]
MYYLFIFESIGTSELILIAVVALMIFGPRKLPDLIRTMTKTMAEFRRSTDEFKRTWEKEVDFEDGKNNTNLETTGYLGMPITNKNSIERNSISSNSEIIAPEIREIDKEEFEKNFPIKEVQVAKQLEAEEKSTSKQDWL